MTLIWNREMNGLPLPAWLDQLDDAHVDTRMAQMILVLRRQDVPQLDSLLRQAQATGAPILLPARRGWLRMLPDGAPDVVPMLEDWCRVSFDAWLAPGD